MKRTAKAMLAGLLAAATGLAAFLPACTKDGDRRPGTPKRPELGAPIDRMGRALTGNALLGTIAADEVSDAAKEAYNRAPQAAWQQFAPEIGRNLALYDSFDGVAGNQWWAARSGNPDARYRALAALLADDRLWVNTNVTVCAQYLAVELAAQGTPNSDCGGRTPNHNVNGVFRSLLIRGTTDTVDDGVDHDDQSHSTTLFPFLAAP